MTNFLDTKIDELLDLSMRMKRHFMSEHLKANPNFGLRNKMQEHFKGLNSRPGAHGVDVRTMLQSETLRFINKNPNCSMKDLADHLLISMSSATQLIERLAFEELIVRSDDETDRRIIRLNITEKGKQDLDKCLVFIKEKIRNVYSNLDNKEIEDFIRIVNKMLAGSETKTSI